MLVATVLALTAALLHAGWNLRAKRSPDRLISLWGQFFVAGVVSVPVVVATHDLPAAAWGFAALTAVTHVPYAAFLAAAYDHGDFSVAYPIARGSGAALAGLGGIVLLGDHLGVLGGVGLLTVAAGMVVLAAGADRVHVLLALGVGVTIGVYTVNDSHASRTFGVTYAFAAFALAAIAVTSYGILHRGAPALVASMRTDWRRHVVSGAMTAAAYVMVLIAVRRAPVGYVASLRESSVLAAAFLGTRYLSEGQSRRRTAAAVVILTGLVLLVVSG